MTARNRDGRAELVAHGGAPGTRDPKKSELVAGRSGRKLRKANDELAARQAEIRARERERHT